MKERIFYSSEWLSYEAIEQHYKSSFNRKCINGKIVGRTKCVGYCHYDGHPGYLTADLRKKHNCLGKDCAHYVQKTKQAVLSPFEETLHALLA